MFLLITFLSFGQKKSVIDLIRSDHSEGVKMQGKDVIKVYKGVFKQDYSLLTSDSAYFYPQQNAFDAFGHVNINQGDTLNIYSDKLNYNGNTKIAILTDHVRMVDKDATLYTDFLTYNTFTRVGTYTGGGKLVNKDNTLTSKNGYYYAFTRDSYFRYNVVLLTPDAIIKTDTLRYNTHTRISYFYGPTDIYGTTGPKNSRDTLYTENGTYNTVTEQAFFGKNNLYRQGTKTLKGDSLFYDKLKGFGKAVKHITFSDTEQKMNLKGDLGTYYKADERTVVTENAYGTLVTEETDTTKTDSAKLKPGVKNEKAAGKVAATDKKQVLKTGIKDTTAFKADTTSAKLAQKNDQVDHTKQVAVKPPEIKPVSKDTANSLPKILTKIIPAKGQKQDKVSKNVLAKTDTLKGGVKERKTRPDTIYYTADTLQTQILMYKDLKILRENMRLAGLRDTSIKKIIVKKRNPKFLYADPAQWYARDTAYLHRGYFGKPKPVIKKKPVINKKRALQDSLRRARPDSVYIQRQIVLSDTSRVRILSAFRHAKMFKSDLQARADSIFYSNSDSTIRCYVQPMIWTQGSQLSGDTIYLQMKNKKLDNMEMFPKAFIANLEKGDSVNFNQMAGKKMRGFFYDGKLNKMFIDGNAESIYFVHDSLAKPTGMQRSLSSRIRVNFADGKVTDLTFYTKPENQYGPPGKLKEDDKVLKSFIWKPKDRPVSKESIIPSLSKKPAGKPSAGKGVAAGKNQQGIKKPTDKDLSTLKGLIPNGKLQPALDSLKSKAMPLIKQDSAIIKMGIKNITTSKKDSTKKP